MRNEANICFALILRFLAESYFLIAVHCLKNRVFLFINLKFLNHYTAAYAKLIVDYPAFKSRHHRIESNPQGVGSVGIL